MNIGRETIQANTLKQATSQEASFAIHNVCSSEDIQMLNADRESEMFDGVSRGRVAIFIDGSSLFYAALQLGIEVDYTKLLCRLIASARLLRAFFYTGVERTNEKQQGFLLWMRRNGYRVVSKDLVQFADGSRKADLDVEIAVDMMTLANYCDTVVLVSGNGDLAYAVDAVTYRGVRVEIVSLRSMTSDSLINLADEYIDLDSIKEEIQKTFLPS